jgi:hypothetical protein
MIAVNYVKFDELTKIEQQQQPDAGYRRQYAGYIKVTNGGSTIGVYSDATEKDGCEFYKIPSWVKIVIQHAYEQGKKDG